MLCVVVCLFVCVCVATQTLCYFVIFFYFFLGDLWCLPDPSANRGLHRSSQCPLGRFPHTAQAKQFLKQSSATSIHLFQWHLWSLEAFSLLCILNITCQTLTELLETFAHFLCITWVVLKCPFHATSFRLSDCCDGKCMTFGDFFFNVKKMWNKKKLLSQLCCWANALQGGFFFSLEIEMCTITNQFQKSWVAV